MPRIIDVSHVIEAGMKTYPGLPEPEIEVWLDYEASRERYRGKAEFRIASLHLCGNTGTYVDSPRHRFRTGLDLAELPLASVAHLPVVKVDVRERSGRAIWPETFRSLDIREKAVLFNTGWAKHWRTPAYFEQHPFLTADSCECLIEAGARFVGIDSMNIDDTDDLTRPAHTLLLGEGIPICEHMTNLELLAPRGGFLHAAPLAWAGGVTFPVRAYVVYPPV